MCNPFSSGLFAIVCSWCCVFRLPDCAQWGFSFALTSCRERPLGQPVRSGHVCAHVCEWNLDLSLFVFYCVHIAVCFIDNLWISHHVHLIAICMIFSFFCGVHGKLGLLHTLHLSAWQNNVSLTPSLLLFSLVSSLTTLCLLPSSYPKVI